MITIPVRKTAKGLATQIQKSLQTYVKREWSQSYGFDPNRIIVRFNEEFSSWDVMWEDGPYEWAHCFLNGVGIFSNEGFGKMSPEFNTDAIRNNTNLDVDLMNSFTVSVSS